MVQPQGAVDFVKGTDDLLVHGGAAALAALPVLPFKQWLDATSKQAITDHLLQPFKTSGRQHRTIARHFKASDLPSSSALVALIGGLGTNKTGAVAELANTSRMVSITHRRSLADNQGHRFGLAVKREGQVMHAFDQSQAHLRQVESLLAEHEGFVVVVDSSYIGGSSELRPDQCRGAVLFIDEADAFLRHCLTASHAHRQAPHQCSGQPCRLRGCCRPGGAGWCAHRRNHAGRFRGHARRWHQGAHHRIDAADRRRPRAGHAPQGRRPAAAVAKPMQPPRAFRLPHRQQEDQLEDGAGQPCAAGAPLVARCADS
jgi:hypothetical protein